MGGTDTLDYSAYTTARNVQLTATGSVDGFDGAEASISGGFTNMDVYVGGSGQDGFTGLNAASAWLIDENGFQYTEGYWSRSSSSLAEMTNTTTAAGGDETRPRNIAMMYCIKV